MLDSSDMSQEIGAPVLRSFGRFNPRGCWTLFAKELARFLKIYPQTLLSPVVMSVLFYAVFHIGAQAQGQAAQAYPAFLVAGLVMMTILQNAFFNSSSSLILSKLQGNIVDLIMAPLSPFEWVLSFALAGVVRGVLVGLMTVAALALVVDLPLASPWIALFYAVAGSLCMALLGFLAGIWGDGFDTINALQTFVIMPATFLSGTFFPISALPSPWNWIGRLNPFFYLIDGFRFGFTGVSESAPVLGAVFLVITNVVLFVVAVKMVASGVKLKK